MSSATHTAVVWLRRDGKDYIIHHPAWGRGSDNEWIWREGNYSCDCNRLMFIDDEYDVVPGGGLWSKESFPCGDTIELIDIRFEEGWSEATEAEGA